MFLRELDGFYKGQIREFPADIGQALIAAGRAVNPFADAAPVAPVMPVPVAKAPAKPSSTRSQKAGRK